MAEDNVRRQNENSDDRNDLALLGDYAKSLNKSADALLKAANSFESSSSNLGRGIHSEVNKLQSILSNFAESFGREMKSVEEESNGKRAKTDGQALSDIDKIMNKDHQSRENSLSKAQKIGSSLIQTFSVVAGYAIDKLKTGFYSIVDNFNENLTSVTTRMQQSNSQYSQMLQRSTDWIKDNGLDKQFSQIDWTKSLLSVLDTGIRGQTAQDMAYQNMVTNKLLPMINTNTRAYTKMSKTFGEEFTKGMTAIGTYTERLYGAEGLEEGGFDNLIEQVYQQVQTAVKEQGGTKEDVDSIMENFVGSYSENARKYGSEAAEDMLSQFSKAINNNIAEGDVMSLVAAEDSGISGGHLENLNKNTLGDFFDSITNQYLQQGSSGAQAQMAWSSQAGIGNWKTSQAINNAEYFGDTEGVESWREASKKFSAGAEYKDQVDNKLKDGWYQSVTDQQIKFNENVMADLGDLSAEYIPDVRGTLTAISSIIKIWFNTWLGWKSAEKVGSLFSKTSSSFFGGGSGGVFKNANAAAELFNEGATFSEVASVGGKGSAVLGKIGSFGGASSLGGGLLNLAAGPGALIAGTAMAGKDAWEAGTKFADAGASTSTVIGQGARSALTGHTGMTSDEEVSATQAALSGQKREFNWGELASNTGKGALIGAGVGTAAGGWAAGLGTVIGGAVGGITGAITNAIDQWQENKKFNDLADASTELQESMSKLKETTSSYTDTVKKGKSANEMLEFVMENRGSKDQELADQAQSQFEFLQEMYPEQLGNLSSINDLDEQYVKVVENKIQRENELAEAQVAAAASDASTKISDQISAFDEIAAGNIKSEASLDFVDAVLETGGENGDQWSSDQINDELNKQIEEHYGLTAKDGEEFNKQKEALIKELNSGKSGEIIKTDGDGNYVLAGQSGGGTTAGDNMQQYKDDYSKSSEYRNTVISNLGNSNTNLSDIYASAKTIFDQQTPDKDGNVQITDSLDNTLSSFESSLEKIQKTADEYSLAYLKPKKESFDGIEDMYKALGRDIPKFKLGAYKTKEGPAYLHDDEMVLTASNADKLRSLSEGEGVSKYLSGLNDANKGKVVKAKTVEQDSSTSEFDPLVSAIQVQTKEITDVLNSIFDAILKLTNGSSSERITNATILPESLLQFKGS